MKKVFNWFENEPSSNRQLAVNYLTLLVLTIGLPIVGHIIVNCLGVHCKAPAGTEKLYTGEIHSKISDFFMVVIWGPWTEEIIFRAIPLGSVMYFLEYKYIVGIYKYSILFVVLIITSIIFGWTHGSVTNIPVQGVAGFFLGITFLKFAKVNDNFSSWNRGIMGSFSIHMTNNLLCSLSMLF